MTLRNWIIFIALLLPVALSHAATNRELTATQIKNGSGLLKIPSSTPTASRACVWDASSIPSASSVTSTELGYLSGVTSNIQDQLDAASGGITQLTGDVTAGPGTGSQAATIGALKVTNGMLAGSIEASKLAGSIEASKLVGTDIATVGTVTSGTWSATAIGPTKGGTGQTTVATGDLLYGSASDVWSKLSAGTLGQTLYQGASGLPEWRYPLGMSKAAMVYDDFCSYISGRGLVAQGVGATYSDFDATYSVPDGTTVCITKSTLSNTTHYISWSPSTSGSSGTLSGGAWFFETRLLMSNLSDATDTQSLRVGSGDTSGQAEPTDGCFVYYTHSNNSGNLTCRCCNNASCTSQDSAIAMTAGEWWKFRVTSNSDGTSVQCSASVSGGAFSNVGAAVTTNIPVAYPRITWLTYLQWVKTAGTGSRFIIWDYAYSLKDVTR